MLLSELVAWCALFLTLCDAQSAVILNLAMKKEQLAQQLAKESRITPAAAADQVDAILNAILKRVRRGQSASLPGLGTFLPGRKEDFRFERSLPVHKGSKRESR